MRQSERRSERRTMPGGSADRSWAMRYCHSATQLTLPSRTRSTAWARRPKLSPGNPFEPGWEEGCDADQEARRRAARLVPFRGSATLGGAPFLALRPTRDLRPGFVATAD